MVVAYDALQEAIWVAIAAAVKSVEWRTVSTAITVSYMALPAYSLNCPATLRQKAQQVKSRKRTTVAQVDPLDQHIATLVLSARKTKTGLSY